jgi:hypothetical protein
LANTSERSLGFSGIAKLSLILFRRARCESLSQAAWH